MAYGMVLHLHEIVLTLNRRSTKTNVRIIKTLVIGNW